MSFREIFTVLLRRWAVLAAGLVVTASVGWVAIHPTPTWKAVSVLTLRGPRSEASPNQFSDGRPSIALTGALISERLASGSGDAQLRQDGVRGRYQLAPRNSGTSATPAYAIPSVEISVITTSQVVAMRSVNLILERFRSELALVQDEWGVQAGERITGAILAPPGLIAMPVVKSRVLLGIALFGGTASVLLALWIDMFLAWRWTRPSAEDRRRFRRAIPWLARPATE